MVNFFTPPGLEGLYDLDRKGVDIRPTLLRVLTDQYLRNPVHSAEEVERYTELASRLFGEVDIATRATVSARLAPHASAPRAIILDLARDVLDVAEPVLLHSPLLTPADCDAIIAERGACYAEILARRGKLTAAETPVTMARPEVTFASVDAPSQPLPDAHETSLGVSESHHAPIDPDAGAEACELRELFFAAGGLERRLILLNLDFAASPAEPLPAPLLRADIWRIETAALRHNAPIVVRELERALAISYQQARRMVEDDLGEPIVIAAKAMGLPADVLQRILLFINPRVGQSVNRVYELSALYHDISVAAAQRMLAIMRAAEHAERKADETRALHSTVDTARRALSEINAEPARRPQAATLPRAAESG